MIKIGYLGNEGGDALGLENLIECKPTPIKLLGGALTRCPAVRGYHMNTFEVKCPFDLEWTVWREENRWEVNIENTSLSTDSSFSLDNLFTFDKENTNVQINYRPGWSFISDTPNTILLQHTNGIDTNPQIISGMINIYDWPDRALSIGYSLTEKVQTFKIKRGKPWYRVTFITPDLEPVKLIKMTERHPYLVRTQIKDHLATIEYQNWRKIFKYFGKTRPKKLIP